VVISVIEKPISHPAGVEEVLCGRRSGIIRSAVLAVARQAGADGDALLAEVRSELAIKMLSGRFPEIGGTAFDAYLAASARNCAWDLIRRLPRWVSLDAGGAEIGRDARLGSEEEPWEVVARDEEEASLEEALRFLERKDPKGAGILKAHYLERIPYREIAERLGAASVEAVHLRAHRARRMLRRRFEGPR
jgi:RNA polymerase sigma factor (sigma-70 family)